PEIESTVDDRIGNPSSLQITHHREPIALPRRVGVCIVDLQIQHEQEFRRMIDIGDDVGESIEKEFHLLIDMAVMSEMIDPESADTGSHHALEMASGLRVADRMALGYFNDAVFTLAGGR